MRPPAGRYPGAPLSPESRKEVDFVRRVQASIPGTDPGEQRDNPLKFVRDPKIPEPKREEWKRRIAKNGNRPPGIDVHYVYRDSLGRFSKRPTREQRAQRRDYVRK